MTSPPEPHHHAVPDPRRANFHHLRDTAEGVIEELYDVALLQGVRRPMALGLKTDEIRRVITIGEPQPL